MKTLALDQATLKSGYAVFDGKALVEYGVINLSKRKVESSMRCREMVMEIYKIILKHQPDRVIMEGVALQKNPEVLIMLARIQGGIVSLCDSEKIPVAILKPSEWRKKAGIKQGKLKREELKQKAQELVRESFKIEVSDDEADAICLGLVTHKFEED